MNANTAPKSPAQNRLEGFALTAIFQGLPTFSAAVLILKVVGAHEIVGERGGAAIFVVLAALVYAAVTPWLVSKFPILFRKASEPVFFDANLSVSDKVAQWRSQPRVSLQLVTTVIMLSLLAVAVASIG
ncbi:hypothetical protein UP09_17030 [Bradyrhizobium sp. LTSP885]|uniref:hypothetical protein n=1 Tax=Bradyrhizobium sp. LTSP885 TaxID=1619232 RepID=UPI0005C80822|nr:hypothetical protein [Bradyrhizobium sp. LTSP885]KJC43680.1 hypothetical protein UP09_17030 [Bradyrhizobium sp. LTSP885]